MTEKANADVAKMSFEDAMAALEKIVDQLDRGDVSLDQSIEIYERGATLQRHCEEKLKHAEMRVQKIVAGADGKAAGLDDSGID